MNIRIPYIESDFTLAAGEDHVMVTGNIGDDLSVELDSYAGLLPLVPGDVLWLTGVHESGDLVATSVVSLHPCWLYKIDVHVPTLTTVSSETVRTFLDGCLAAAKRADQVELELSNFVPVSRPWAFSVQVAADDNAWLVAYMNASHLVAGFRAIRFPGQEVNLGHARRTLGLSR